MVDHKTARAYATNAATYSRDWLEQPAPTDMYALFDRYFLQHGETADIGCGSGRDAAWLAGHGFPVTGYDGSSELLARARARFPDIAFRLATLPGLGEISSRYDNVLCETVIMHLPAPDIPEALANLLRIMKPGGVLYLSWRVTEAQDERHGDGRLYSAFAPDLVRRHLADCAILHVEDVQSVSSGKRICRIVARKPAA